MDRRLQQLKNDARREEQRENWGRAIELYREALHRSEEVGSVSLDVSLYNRVGDLHRRLGDADLAVRFYLEAVDRYAEQDLHTGAVALCNKVLRIAPERTEVHRKLGRLHAVTGLTAEARRSYETYVDRMREEGRHRERRAALLEMAELTGDRELLLEVTGDMVEAGEREGALSALLRRADTPPDDPRLLARIRSIDPTALEPEAARPAAAGDAAGTAAGRPVAAGAGPVDLSDVLRELDRAEAAGQFAAPPGRTPAGGGEPDERPASAADEARGGVPRQAGEADVDGDVAIHLRYAEVLVRSGQASAAREQLDELRRELGEAGRTEAARRVDEEIERLEAAAEPEPEAAGSEPAPGRAEKEPAREEPPSRADRPVHAEPGDHVEMSLALFEMGRIDDAIRELQLASRADDPPLRAFEVLGQCFLGKDLPKVAIRVLNRALHLPGHAEHELLGVLHRLGVAHQTMGEHQKALDCFQRVYAIDIDFRDVSERMEQVLPHL